MSDKPKDKRIKELESALRDLIDNFWHNTSKTPEEEMAIWQRAVEVYDSSKNTVNLADYGLVNADGWVMKKK